MDRHVEINTDSDSEVSSHPYFFKTPTSRSEVQRVWPGDDVQAGQRSHDNFRVQGIAASVEGATNIMSTVLGSQLQELVMKAVLQSTASLVGSSATVFPHAGTVDLPSASVSAGHPASTSTWNELAFYQAQAKRNKKPDMMRTSAGENSDSQEGYSLPENATREQRALRTRTLSRWRATKARHLTSNRRAVHKLPYVIHVDGTSKPRGIYKRQWKAAVRGQCGRLDPTKDNINHHPKNVVDSIWHALESEWEFQGFAHKAREMFERSATKFMRNKKMQLKYKCQKTMGTGKPDDVTPTHWLKVVDLMKKSMKEQAAGTLGEGVSEVKTMDLENEMVDTDNSTELECPRQVSNDNGLIEKRGQVGTQESMDKQVFIPNKKAKAFEDEVAKRSPNLSFMAGDFVVSEEEHLQSQITSLRSQLEWLQNSRKAQMSPTDEFNDVTVHVSKGKGNANDVRRVKKARKENVPPSSVSGEQHLSTSIGVSGKRQGKELQTKAVHSQSKRTSTEVAHEAFDGSSLQGISDMNTMEEEEIECSDVISIAAVVEGNKTNIGKGVLMGFAGSRCSRKIIPEGWCSIKVSSCTPSAACETCPIPPGWKDQGKQQTLKDAESRIILWPRSLVHL